MLRGRQKRFPAILSGLPQLSSAASSLVANVQVFKPSKILSGGLHTQTSWVENLLVLLAGSFMLKSLFNYHPASQDCPIFEHFTRCPDGFIYLFYASLSFDSLKN